jgi:hypothetical protein
MARLAEQLTTDFSYGMFDSVSPTRYPSAAAAYIENARIQADGTVRRRPGSQRTTVDALQSANSWGLTYFVTAGGVEQIVAFCAQRAFKSEDQGETWDQIATGLRQDYYSFCTMRVGASMYLFCANGDTTIKKWDGTTWGTVSNAPQDVKYVATFNSRLYATGHDGTIVQASKIGDPDTWASPDGLLVQVQTHGGETPTALYQIGKHLLVFDTKATSYIDGFGQQTLIVAAGATGFSRSVGCVAFRSIAPIGDAGLAWLSERGVEYYQPGESIRLQTRPIDTFMESIVKKALLSQAGRPDACYDATNQNYHLALSTTGSTNNRVLVLNLRENVEEQRQGTTAAATVDNLYQPSGEAAIFFAGDANGYLVVDAAGKGTQDDYYGYMRLVGSGETGDLLEENVDGYLESTSIDNVPACMTTVPTVRNTTEVFTLGHDCWLRRHSEGLDKDDMHSDESSGSEITMKLISAPFLMGEPRRRKRGRVIHIASIQENAVTIDARMYGHGETSSFKAVEMDALGLDHAARKRVTTNLKADAPQVEIWTTDDVRISMLGLSAEILREPV